MDEDTIEAIRKWSLLKKEKELFADLDVRPDEVKSSKAVQKKIILAYEAWVNRRNIENIESAKREKLEQTVRKSLKAISTEIEKELGVKFWMGHWGVLEKDPSSLSIYAVLPTNLDISSFSKLSIYNELGQKLKKLLNKNGYPDVKLSLSNITLYSEQMCKEQAGGNWFNFFK